MSLAGQILEGFRTQARRNKALAARVHALEQRLAKQEREQGRFLQYSLAPLMAPGSPLLQLGENVIARIDGEHPDHTGERIYQATVQVATAHGEWSPEDEPLQLTVIGYPQSGDGSEVSHRPTFLSGAYVLVRWDGRDPDEATAEELREFYHAIPLNPAGSCWWGIVTQCDKLSGFAKVRQASGEIGSLTVDDAGSDEITVFVGKGSFVRVDDEVQCVPNKAGATPEYTAHRIIEGIIWEEPDADTELAPNQDNPNECSTCCDETVSAS